MIREGYCYTISDAYFTDVIYYRNFTQDRRGRLIYYCYRDPVHKLCWMVPLTNTTQEKLQRIAEIKKTNPNFDDMLALEAKSGAIKIFLPTNLIPCLPKYINRIVKENGEPISLNEVEHKILKNAVIKRISMVRSESDWDRYRFEKEGNVYTNILSIKKQMLRIMELDKACIKLANDLKSDIKCAIDVLENREVVSGNGVQVEKQYLENQLKAVEAYKKAIKRAKPLPALPDYYANRLVQSKGSISEAIRTVKEEMEALS